MMGVLNEKRCKNSKSKNLKIAELGILDGASLLMWQEYFINAEIYGFEYDENLINNFTQLYIKENFTPPNTGVSNEKLCKECRC